MPSLGRAAPNNAWKVGIVWDTAKPMLGLHGLNLACRGLPGVAVVGHVDSNPAGVEHRMAVTGARRHYAQLEPMLDRERPDIVILCSRHPGDHLPQIRAAAERKCHVYCEKPLAATLEDVDAICALLERHRVKLCVPHYARHSLGFLTMRKLIAEGAIGRPLSFMGRGKEDDRGGGEDLMVLGTHILDLQNLFFGPPLSVCAAVRSGGTRIGTVGRNHTVEPIGPAAGDDVHALFLLDQGVRGVFESRRGLAQRGVVRMGVTVTGSEGALSMRFHDYSEETPLRIHRGRQAPEDGAPFEPVPLQELREFPADARPLDYALCGKELPVARFFLEAQRLFLADLMHAIEEDRQPFSNAEDARRVQEMIQGIYASSLAGRMLEFPLRDQAHPLAGWTMSSEHPG